MTLALLLAAAAAAYDAAPAKVEKVSGEVAFRLLEDGGFKLEPAATGRRLDAGDAFKTLERARAQVVLPAEAVALLAPQTTLAMEEDRPHARAAVLEGAALFGLRRPLDRGKKVTVRTPAATAFLEAGTFAVVVDAQSARFRLLAGALRVRAEGRTVRLKPGEEVAVTYGKKPGDPKPWTSPEPSTGTFAIEGSLGGLEGTLSHGVGEGGGEGYR